MLFAFTEQLYIIWIKAIFQPPKLPSVKCLISSQKGLLNQYKLLTAAINDAQH